MLVISIVVVALLAAAVIVATAQKQYVATADIAISPVSANDDTFQGFSVFHQSLDGSSVVVTAARVFDAPQIRVPARVAMGADGIGTSVAITPLSQSDIIAIEATADSASKSAKAASKFAQSVVASRSALFQSELNSRTAVLRAQIAAIPLDQRSGNFQYATLAQRLATLNTYRGFGDPTVKVAALATVPAGPSWPRPKLTFAVALIASLLLGCGLAVLLEFFNPKVAREDELVLEQRLPILARIPRMRKNVVNRYLTGRRPLPASAWKGYRVLRAVLTTAGPDGGLPRSILITSASPGDGKTMTAANLAITLAAADLRVVLVDGDLHRPAAAVMFSRAPRGDGLAGVLSGQQAVRDALTESPYPGLSLLLAHRDPAVRANLMGERRIKALLAELRPFADVVIVDSPPLPEVAEALEMAAAVDTVLICARLGNTRRDKLNQLREMLSRRGIAPAGFVLTSRLVSDQGGAYEEAYAGAAPHAPSRASGNGDVSQELARPGSSGRSRET